jgi:uncharacterized membrane protein YfcA
VSPVALLAGVVLLSFFVEAAAGFGSMVVALTLGSLAFGVNELLAVLIPVNMVLSAYLVLRGWGAIEWRLLLVRWLPLLAVGLALGTVVAARASEAAWLKPAFGLFVVLVAAWQLASTLRPELGAGALPLPAKVAALLGAGAIHGVFATGGPLVVFVAARELPGKAAFRASLSVLWLVLNALVMPRLVLDGHVTTATLSRSAAMLLPLGAGIVAGEWLHHRLDERKFRLLVGALLLAAGAVLAIKSWPGAGVA